MNQAQFAPPTPPPAIHLHDEGTKPSSNLSGRADNAAPPNPAHRRPARLGSRGATTRRLPSLVVPSPGAPSTNDLATARPLEGQTLGLLLASNAWPRRAIAAVRLERFDDAESRELLVGLLGDPAWQVRCFAVRSLSRRGVPAGEGWFTAEDHPRVLRTALRYRYAIDPDRLNRGVRYLAKEPSFDLKMLAVELGATSTDPDVQALVLDTAKKIILRMDRADGGVLSPRLAAVTGQPDLRRHYLWQRWLMTSGRTLRIDAAYAVPEGTESRREPLSAIAALDVDRFADLVDYIESLRSREIDLAICLDTTASMHEELAEVQGGIDDLMLFVGDVVQKLQVGIVAYRDRRDRYETTGWDFTSDVALARQRLWELTADGGGDSPESVYPALRETLSKLSWGNEHTNILILIGDAPPHVGFGIRCVELASERMRGRGW